MVVHALTVEAVRDGPLCALLLHGALDLSGASGFLAQAALVIDDRAEELVLPAAAGDVTQSLLRGPLSRAYPAVGRPGSAR
jgi:hypothetical protein